MEELKEAENADYILGIEDLPVEIIDVPEWKCRLRVRGMSGIERDAFEASCVTTVGEGKKKKTKADTTNIRAKVVARCAINAKGERLFSDAHVEALGKKSGAALNRVWEVAGRLSGMTDEDVEELAGNS